jgi:hypothetical protein
MTRPWPSCPCPSSNLRVVRIHEPGLRRRAPRYRDLLVSEQAVRVTERKRCRNAESLKVARDGNERRVAGVDGVDTHTLGAAKVLVSGQNGISTTPAEANHTDLVGTGNHAHLGDEFLNQGTSVTLTMLEQPGTEGCARLCRGGGLFCE